MTDNETGLFERVGDTRTIRGLLLPFGELSSPNQSGNEPIMFSADSIKLPRDPSVVTLNDEHDRFNPIGRATSVEATEAGVVAEFAIADTDEGDAYLAAPKRKLSAEVAGIVRDAADKTRATFARLTGAAVVTEGAFASAGLFSVATDENDADTRLAEMAQALDDLKTRLADLAQAAKPATAPVEETNTNKEAVVTDANETGAQVPATLLNTAPVNKSQDVEPAAVFAAMHAVKNGMAGQTADAESMLAALSDITVNTTGGLTTAASGVLQPAWVGKLWQGKSYVRKYIDLVNHQYGGIQLGGRKGFTLDQGTALVAHWNGNKAELPSGKATTSTKSSSLRKFGFGADVAREWYDLEGGAEVLASFFAGVVESYAEITDADALADIMALALADIQAPGTAPANYPAEMSMLIDAIEYIQDNGDDPSFALVNPVAWRNLIQTPKDLVPEFVSFDFTVGGEGTADGKVHVRKAPASAFTGLDATKPAIAAGAKNALELREQGQTPIQLDALDIARGGVDKAVIGYLETFAVRPESFVTFGTDSV